MNNGSIGLSLFLIAVGAILAWAVDATVSGIDIRVAGAILMVIGVIGLALSLLFWSTFAPFARRETRAVTTVRDEPVIYTEPVHRDRL